MKPSPLEQAILAKYHEAYSGDGFPSPDKINVLARENSGSGRFIDLSAPLTSIVSHACGLPQAVEMEGLEHGIGFVLFIEQGKLDMLELFTYEESWDGEERPWRLVTVTADAGVGNA